MAIVLHVPAGLLGQLATSCILSIIAFALATLSYDLLTIIMVSVAAGATILHHVVFYALTYRKWHSPLFVEGQNWVMFFTVAGIGWSYVLLCMWIISLGIVITGGNRVATPGSNGAWAAGGRLIDGIAVALQAIMVLATAVYCTMRRSRLKETENNIYEANIFYPSLVRNHVLRSQNLSHRRHIVPKQYRPLKSMTPSYVMKAQVSTFPGLDVSHKYLTKEYRFTLLY